MKVNPYLSLEKIDPGGVPHNWWSFPKRLYWYRMGKPEITCEHMFYIWELLQHHIAQTRCNNITMHQKMWVDDCLHQCGVHTWNEGCKYRVWGIDATTKSTVERQLFYNKVSIWAKVPEQGAYLEWPMRLKSMRNHRHNTQQRQEPTIQLQENLD